MILKLRLSSSVVNIWQLFQNLQKFVVVVVVVIKYYSLRTYFLMNIWLNNDSVFLACFRQVKFCFKEE